MEHNKVYFSLYYRDIPNEPNQIIVNNVGLVVKGFNFRRILGNLYYKYNAFSIKLESYICRTAATTDPTLDFYLFHIAGLNFINGYDSSPNYNYSRALEVIDFSGTTPTTNFNFISACNTTMFYKPTSDTIDLTFFYTKISDELLVVNPDDVFYMFSITGVDAYKVQNPQKPLIKRPVEMRSVNFSLQSYKAEIIESRNRAYRFNNINLRNIIGQDYDKYSKFCLITKYINFSRNNGITFMTQFSGFLYFQFCLSGLDFISLSGAQYDNTSTTIQRIHPSTPSIIALGAFTFAFPYESYIENSFYKSSDVVDIVISYNSMYGYDLVPSNVNNTELFPQFTINFDIVPLE